jgi:hypothetical protein
MQAAYDQHRLMTGARPSVRPERRSPRHRSAVGAVIEAHDPALTPAQQAALDAQMALETANGQDQDAYAALVAQLQAYLATSSRTAAQRIAALKLVIRVLLVSGRRLTGGGPDSPRVPLLAQEECRLTEGWARFVSLSLVAGLHHLGGTTSPRALRTTAPGS